MLISLRMIYLSVNQTIYVVILVFSILIVLGLIAFVIIKNFYRPKHIKELTYLKLKNLCNANDYLLLNNYKLHLDDKNIGTIDHVVICDKFIVIVNDFALSGVLSGDFADDELILYNDKGANRILNPLNYNFNVAKRLALYNDLGQSLLKGLVMVNSDCKINMTSNNHQFKIIRVNELKKTIKQFDKANVKNLKEDDVVRFINYLDSNNIK